MKDSFKGKRVLIVEDDPGLLETLQFEFKYFGCEVVTAQNGAEAMDKYKSNKFDFIASDVRMPVCDGIQFLQNLRSHDKVTPPFVFLTGFSEHSLWDVLNQGADTVLQKPINPKNLHEVISKLLCPIEERWKDKPSEAIALELSLDPSIANNLELGRSGFFVSNAKLRNFSEVRLMQLVSFTKITLASDLGPISGIGKIVWKRERPTEKLAAGCGVEFLYIPEPDRKTLLAYLKKHPLAVVVPSGNGAGKTT